MWRLAPLLVVFGACGKSAENKPTADEAPSAKTPEDKSSNPTKAEAPKPPTPDDEGPDEPSPPPPEEPPEPVAGGGECTVIATAGREFKQVSGGGPTAANVYQWHTPETRKQNRYKDTGFTLNCNGSNIKLAIATAPSLEVPFGTGQYKVGDDGIRVTGTLGNTSIARASGALSIEKFDDKHLAGRLTLYINETVPPSDMFKLIADFNFSCSGLSGCK